MCWDLLSMTFGHKYQWHQVTLVCTLLSEFVSEVVLMTTFWYMCLILHTLIGSQMYQLSNDCFEEGKGLAMPYLNLFDSEEY